MGDVLPNDERFRYKTKTNTSISQVRIGNITRKVLNAIDSVLDMYFAYKSDEFTVDQINILKMKGSIMEANIKILWNLKQTLCFETVRHVGMSKLHNHNHYPEHIKRFGAPLYANTDTFESAHRKYTTRLWRNSSRRHGTLNKEMLMASIAQQHNQHLAFYNALFRYGTREELYTKGGFSTSYPINKNYVPPITPIYIGDYCCKIVLDNNGFENMVGHGPDANLVLLDAFFGHAAIKNLDDIYQLLIDHFEDTNNFDYREPCCYMITQGVRIEANKSADILDHAFVYCTKYYKGNFKRYDYVVVDVEYDNGTKGRQVAQVICIVDVRQDTPLLLYSLKQLFIVQYLQEDTFTRHDGRTDIQNMYKQLKWELAPNPNFFNVGIIDSKTIVDVAVVIPFFSYYEDLTSKSSKSKQHMYQMPIMGQPNVHDRFYYIERRYFDRSGWNELYTNTSLGGVNDVQNVNDYIARNTYGRPNSRNINNDEDEDEDEEEEEEEEDEEEEDEEEEDEER